MGGEALRLYRDVHAAVKRDLRNSMCLARVPCPLPVRTLLLGLGFGLGVLDLLVVDV